MEEPSTSIQKHSRSEHYTPCPYCVIVGWTNTQGKSKHFKEEHLPTAAYACASLLCEALFNSINFLISHEKHCHSNLNLSTARNTDVSIHSPPVNLTFPLAQEESLKEDEEEEEKEKEKEGMETDEVGSGRTLLLPALTHSHHIKMHWTQAGEDKLRGETIEFENNPYFPCNNATQVSQMAWSVSSTYSERDSLRSLWEIITDKDYHGSDSLTKQQREHCPEWLPLLPAREIDCGNVVILSYLV
jgi:hypothetical protein